MMSLKTAAKVAMYGCIITAAFSLGMSVWTIAIGNMMGLGISLTCLGVMIACAMINYRNLQRLS